MISRRQFVHFFKLNLIIAGSFLFTPPNTFSQSLSDQYNSYNECSLLESQFMGYDLENNIYDYSEGYCVIDGKVWYVTDDEVELDGYINKPKRYREFFGSNSIVRLEQYAIEGNYLYFYECIEVSDSVSRPNKCDGKPDKTVVGKLKG